jgi:hypothetical protein
MATSYTDVNPDPVASRIVQSFGRGGPFAVDQVVPLRPVSGKKFRYAKWTFADMVSAHHESKMPDNGPANKREHRGLTWTTGTCNAYGLLEEWGDTERAESALMGMEEDHIMAILEDIVHEMKIGWEQELKTALDASSNSTTLTGTQQWNNASAKILPTFDVAKEAFRHATGVNPTHCIIPEDCWEVFINDSTVLDLIKYTTPGIVEDADATLNTKIRGVTPIIPTALINSANPGAH